MTYSIQTPRLVHSIGGTVGALILGLTQLASAGTPTGEEFQVNTTTPGSQHHPAITHNANNQTIVVWKQDGQEGSSPALMAQRYDPSVALVVGESILHQADTGDVNRPAVAMYDDGTVLAAWEGQSEGGEGVDILAQRYDQGNQPIGPIIRANTTTAGHQRHATVAIGPDGQSMIMWESTPDNQDDTDIFGQHFDANGRPIGTELRLNPTTAGSQTDPAGVFDQQGNLFAIWRGESASGRGLSIYGQYYGPDGRVIGPERVINSPHTPSRMAPAIAINGDGHIEVMWPTDDPEASHLRLVAQHFDLAGNPTVVPDHTNYRWAHTYGQIIPTLAWESPIPTLTVWAEFNKSTKWDIKGKWTFGNDHP